MAETTEQKSPAERVDWHAPEFSYHEKDARWYLYSALVTLVLVTVAVFARNFPFAVFIIIAELLVLYWAKEQPRTLAYELDENGVGIGEKKYALSAFHWFAIIHDDINGDELVLMKRSSFNPGTHILVDSRETAEKIRAFFKGKLPEKKDYEEHLIDVASRILRF